MDGTPALQQEEAVGPKGEHLATEAQPEQATSVRASHPCYCEELGARLPYEPGHNADSGASESHIESQAVPSAVSESRHQAEALQQDPQVQWLQVQEGEDQEHAAEEGQALQEVCRQDHRAKRQGQQDHQ